MDTCFRKSKIFANEFYHKQSVEIPIQLSGPDYIYIGYTELTAADKNRNAIQDSLDLPKNVSEQKVAILDSTALYIFFERFPKLNAYKINLRDF